jgi:hypothetical protein
MAVKAKKPELLIEPATRAECQIAVEKWHYSRKLPAVLANTFRVLEDGRFIGCVMFGCGANYLIGSPFRLSQSRCLELTRVALNAHKTPVTRIISICLRLLCEANHDLRVVVSYADPEQGHEGTIYRAGNWHYLGITKPQRHFLGGVHKRTGWGRGYSKEGGTRYGRKRVKHKFAIGLTPYWSKRLSRMSK